MAERFEIGKVDGMNLNATELRLGLPGTEQAADRRPPAAAPPAAKSGSKRNSAELDGGGEPAAAHRHANKEQVVGWPPVRSHRMKKAAAADGGGGIFVKVSKDGAPYLRKIDLKLYMRYEELRDALEDMFRCFAAGDAHHGGGGIGPEYAVTYEDKDGDLMLVGDVPWGMFISSCKRLRIMKLEEVGGSTASSS